VILRCGKVAVVGKLTNWSFLVLGSGVLCVGETLHQVAIRCLPSATRYRRLVRATGSYTWQNRPRLFRLFFAGIGLQNAPLKTNTWHFSRIKIKTFKWLAANKAILLKFLQRALLTKLSEYRQEYLGGLAQSETIQASLTRADDCWSSRVIATSCRSASYRRVCPKSWWEASRTCCSQYRRCWRKWEREWPASSSFACRRWSLCNEKCGCQSDAENTVGDLQ